MVCRNGKLGALFRRCLGCCIITALLLGGFTPQGETAGRQLYEILVDGKYGFIDQSGAVVIQPAFLAVRPFRDGMAGVELPDGRWVYINADGQIATSPMSDIPAFFSEGIVPVKVGVLYGYMDKTGKMVIPPRYDLAFSFHGGRALVVADDAVVYINTGGTVVEQLPFLRPTGTKADCIDEKGTVLGQVYLSVWAEGGDRIPFELDGKIGFLDRRGKVAIGAQYKSANQYVFRSGSFFNEKIMPVQLDGKTGFIDREGRVAVDFIFDRAEPFYEELSQVSKDGRYGFIDSDGRIVVALQYEYAEEFSEGLAAVRMDGRWGFINRTGQMVIEPTYLDLMWGVPMRFREGLAAVRTETGTGYINAANEIVVPFVYWHGDDFCSGLAKVYRKRSREFEYVNRRGETVWTLGRTKTP